MTIGKDKTRVPVIMTKKLKEELVEEAEKESRSLSNYIVYLIENRKKDTNS